MEKLADQLFLYGPLGIICVLLMYAVYTLWRAKEKQTKDYQDDLKRLQEAHKVEMTQLMQRHIEKAEGWVEKGNELAASLHQVLDSMVRRRS